MPIKEDKWSEREKETARRWWVGELITRRRAAKCITVTARDGRRPAGKSRDQLWWNANRDKPPVVVERVTEDRLVHWTR